MANYMISESVWLLNSFQVAKTRGAFDDISIDEHGTNFSVDMANYVLLLNTGFLNVEKDKFALNGNLNGLSRTEYMSKLDECYNSIKIDVHTCPKRLHSGIEVSIWRVFHEPV